ncbi:Rieske (2Fe-2S) protein [Agromyces intestinalis]|uniref:Cytochrome bc1 complex Rieske iron-sulfur subunit n=1 Tax=Agromyces intestinalis TaxID=2592652 RepID=A0A5C1YLS9_9MICO|nr:Rieske (2Fe-2S) protein [Agromyces intestinalis]QEO15792.1 Rieske (2Fe-2S) protein [Agromyces intestinalis]
MTERAEFTRRGLLTVGGLGATGAALVLAGCAPGSNAPSATSSGDADSGSGGDGTGGGGAEAPGTDVAAGSEVAALADVPVGESISVTIDGADALLAQPSAGVVAAFSAICTHQQCKVAPAGAELHCPCHGSRFDAATGEVLNGPALQPLTPIAVHLDGDRIVTGS